MTLEKNKKISIILIGFGISLVILFVVISDNSCGIRHISIINDLQAFEKTLDPEFCEELVEKIDDFNYECQPQVETLDCG